jgi:hypothetical protein
MRDDGEKMSYRRLTEEGIGFAVGCLMVPFAILGWVVRKAGPLACQAFGHWWAHIDDEIDWECRWCGDMKDGNYN